MDSWREPPTLSGTCGEVSCALSYLLHRPDPPAICPCSSSVWPRPVPSVTHAAITNIGLTEASVRHTELVISITVQFLRATGAPELV